MRTHIEGPAARTWLTLEGETDESMLSVLAAGVAAVVETGRSLVLYVDPDSGSAGRIIWRLTDRL